MALPVTKDILNCRNVVEVSSGCCCGEDDEDDDDALNALANSTGTDKKQSRLCIMLYL